MHAIKYVEQNPVRAGLVNRAEDWTWSSARAHVFGIPYPLPTIAYPFSDPNTIEST
jgi:putative transposase